MIHRALGPADLPVLHGLYMDPEANRFLDYEPMDEEAFRPIFEAIVREGETRLVLDGDRVVGTYRLHVQPFRCAHVATLGSFATPPAARGRGLGGEILGAIVAGLPARGIRRLELLVEADNARAIRFYEKHGFVREGVLRGAFRRKGEPEDIDEIAMAWRA